MTDLLDAVDDLTIGTRQKFMQDTTDGGSVMVTVQQASLLERLDDAIRGTVGVGGAGALASERNMLNAGNLYLAMRINSVIKGWAHMASIETRPSDKPSEVLRSWYVAFEQTARYREDPSFFTGQLVRWKKQILAMFDPPRMRDLPDECPVCNSLTWWQDGKEYARPLVITFHDGPEMIEKGRGSCRSCEAVFGIRELSYAIDEANREKSA